MNFPVAARSAALTTVTAVVFGTLAILRAWVCSRALFHG